MTVSNYDEFIRFCLGKGFDPFAYLLPAEVYQIVDDQGEYMLADVQHLLYKSERHTRRLFENGRIKFLRKRPYACLGIEIKRYLFEEYYSQIMKPLRFR